MQQNNGSFLCVLQNANIQNSDIGSHPTHLKIFDSSLPVQPDSLAWREVSVSADLQARVFEDGLKYVRIDQRILYNLLTM
jgi:hypothetical protein